MIDRCINLRVNFNVCCGKIKIMIKLKFTSQKLFLIFCVGLMLSVSGCSPTAPIIDQPTEEPLVDTPVSPVLEVTTPSPIPEALPTVLMITGTEVDPFMVSQSENMLEKLAEEASMQFATLEGLEPDMLTPEVKVVVGVGQDLDLNTLAVNHPGIVFVAIGSATAAVADNVSVIGNPVVETQQKAFMAGYLSAIISSDNKIAALIAEENPARDLLAESYVVGARFFCGICHQVFPPYGTFPQWEAVSSSTIANDFRAIIDQYSNISVEIMYVHGDLASPELFAYMEEVGTKVVSDRSPDLPRSNWVGTVAVDPAPALEAIWPDLITSGTGKQVPALIVLADRDSRLVSAGRYRLFEVMTADLQSGMVSIEIMP